MHRRRIIWILALIALVIFILWARMRMLTLDRSLAIDENALADPNDETAASLDDLYGRTLVWSTSANVPLKFSAGGDGYGILEILGIPEYLRPVDMNFGREPVRDEWNIATLDLTGSMSGSDVRFLTSNQGTFLHAIISADGRCIVATKTNGEAQEIVRFEIYERKMNIISFSHAIDRWPSCSGDGSRIIFHSYRDENPGGDLYMTVLDEGPDNAWRTLRLTDNPDVQYIWPRLASDGTACVAMERLIGTVAGRLVHFHIRNDILEVTRYLTVEEGHYRFPSLNSSGDMCCWQGLSENKWVIFLWREPDRIQMLEPGLSRNLDAYGLVQPNITPDGKFIVYIEDYLEVGADRIGVFDIRRGVSHYFDGCDGHLIFPSLSDQVNGPNE